jgi:hypothetical protein
MKKFKLVEGPVYRPCTTGSFYKYSLQGTLYSTRLGPVHNFVFMEAEIEYDGGDAYLINLWIHTDNKKTKELFFHYLIAESKERLTSYGDKKYNELIKEYSKTYKKNPKYHPLYSPIGIPPLFFYDSDYSEDIGTGKPMPFFPSKKGIQYNEGDNMKMTGRLGQDIMTAEVGNEFVVTVPLPKWAKKNHILVVDSGNSIKISILKEDLEDVEVFTSYFVSRPQYSINIANYKLKVSNNSLVYGFAGLKFGVATISFPKI